MYQPITLRRLQRWWRTLDSPTTYGSIPLYTHMLTRLQRDMLVLLMLIGSFLSCIVALQIALDVWYFKVQHQAMFWFNWVRLGLLVSGTIFFIRRDHVGAAWTWMLGVSLSLLLVQVVMMNEPGLVVFALFMLTGAALVLPLRLNLLWISLLMLGFLLTSRWTTAPTQVYVTITFFMSVIFGGLLSTGFVVQRWLRQFAATSIEHQHAISEQIRIEQQAIDLRQHVERLAMLEHDLRQPLRAIQGYVQLLQLDRPSDDQMLLAMGGAAERADRLINNLLDQVRAEAARPRHWHQLTDLNPVLQQIATTAAGLSRYYTEPPVPVCVEHAPLPLWVVDRAQLERALLNLLDNALAVAPPQSVVRLSAAVVAAQLCFTIEDAGPGVPAEVLETLFGAGTQPLTGLGLQQVQRMVEAHAGTWTINSTPQGTCVQLYLPRSEEHEH